MIFTFLFYIISYLLTIISVVLPQWTIWPVNLLDSITMLSQAFNHLNWLLPVADFITAFLFLISFEVAYLTAKIGIKIFNYIRGTGSGLDI